MHSLIRMSSKAQGLHESGPWTWKTTHLYYVDDRQICNASEIRYIILMLLPNNQSKHRAIRRYPYNVQLGFYQSEFQLLIACNHVGTMGLLRIVNK